MTKEAQLFLCVVAPLSVAAMVFSVILIDRPYPDVLIGGVCALLDVIVLGIWGLRGE